MRTFASVKGLISFHMVAGTFSKFIEDFWRCYGLYHFTWVACVFSYFVKDQVGVWNIIGHCITFIYLHC